MVITSSRQSVTKKKQQCITLEKDIEDLRARLTKTEGRLAQHENPHTPSSKKPIGQKNNGAGKDKPNKSGDKPKKPGVQKGHQGVTSRYKPTQFKIHIPEMCPLCDTSDLEVTIAMRISFCTANFWASSSLDHHIFV